MNAKLKLTFADGREELVQLPTLQSFRALISREDVIYVDFI